MMGDLGLGPLSVESCINNFSFPSDDNDTVVVATNTSAGGGALGAMSWQEMCEVLLSSALAPGHDPRRHARHMLNYLLMGVAGMTVACFGLIGNLLSAIVLTRRTMTTSTYCYLAALAVCDFLVVACTLVLLIKVRQTHLYFVVSSSLSSIAVPCYTLNIGVVSSQKNKKLSFRRETSPYLIEPKMHLLVINFQNSANYRFKMYTLSLFKPCFLF